MIPPAPSGKYVPFDYPLEERALVADALGKLEAPDGGYGCSPVMIRSDDAIERLRCPRFESVVSEQRHH